MPPVMLIERNGKKWTKWAPKLATSYRSPLQDLSLVLENRNG